MRTIFTAAALVVLLTSALAHAGSTSLREQLVTGQQVKVEGQTTNGVFHARSLTIRDAETTVKVEGAIDEVSHGGRNIRLLNFAVEVDRSTRLYQGSQPTASRAMLVRGAWIEAKGAWRSGVLKATRIRVKPTPEPTQEIEGVIQSSDPVARTLRLLDRIVFLPAAAVVVDERTGGAAPRDPDRLRRDDDDAGARRPIAFGNMVIGGRVEGGFLNVHSFDLDRSDAAKTVLSRAQILASTQITDSVEAYAKFTLTQNLAAGGPQRGDARLSEAYLMVHRLGGAPIDLQLGRQRFRDAREWLYDDYLDAARVHVTLPAVKLEAAVSRGILVHPEQPRDRRDELQFVASAMTDLGAVTIGGYVLARHDSTRNERPIWVGSSAHGRAGINWSYWGEASARRGTSATSRLGGWAFDTGVRHSWSRRWSPTVTVSYAFGSGDRGRDDSQDTRFRQTDLEDNQAYFGGLRRVAIYGELFDPELSNLHVLTAGVAFRPRRNLSLDAIYHRYTQATATSSFPSHNIDGVLNGAHRALGDELNLVFTLRTAPGVDFDLAVGAFAPGAAFVAGRTAVFFWRPQLRFSF